MINLIDYIKINNNIKNKIQKQKKIIIIKKYFNTINSNIIKNCLYYKNFSFNFHYNNEFFNSSSPTIIKYPKLENRYIINIRIVNYKLDSLGKSSLVNNKGITINKIYLLDKMYNPIFSKYLYPYNCSTNNKFIGIEDIRLFNFKNEIYFIGSHYNESNDLIEIVSNKYTLGENYQLTTIKPTFQTDFSWEKNWVFFENNDSINIIYKWYPIYICEIDYINKNLNLKKSLNNIPKFFKSFRGSTNGVNYNDKIWFITHCQKDILNDNKAYIHNFVVFDKNMNLIGYSKPFNFENKLVEFCVGMELTYNNNFVITYSALDSSSKLIVLNPNYINTLIIYI